MNSLLKFTSSVSRESPCRPDVVGITWSFRFCSMRWGFGYGLENIDMGGELGLFEKSVLSKAARRPGILVPFLSSFES